MRRHTWVAWKEVPTNLSVLWIIDEMSKVENKYFGKTKNNRRA